MVRYDAEYGRIFVIAFSGGGDFALAVSKTGTPTLAASDWYFFEFDVGGGHHYQNLAIGSDQVFVTMLINGSATQPRICYLDQADLVNGSAPTLTSIQLSAFQSGQHRLGCVQDYDWASDVGRFVADPPSTSVSSLDLTVDDYKTAPASVDTPASIDFSVTDDMKTSVLRNGHLWTAHTIGVAGSSNESKVRWYEIDLDGWPAGGSSPSVVQSGTIDPGTGVSASYPAIHADDNGNMAIAWNQCSSTEHVSVYRAIRRHDDTAGALRAPLLLKAGTGAPATGSFISDYATMDEVPGDSGVMWSHHMYYESERRTWVGRIDVNRSLELGILPGTSLDPDEEFSLTTRGALPATTVKWWYSLDGCGSTYTSSLDVTLDIANAVFIGQATADSGGTAVKYFTIPLNFPAGQVSLQSAESENSSEVVVATIE